MMARGTVLGQQNPIEIIIMIIVVTGLVNFGSI